MPSLSRKYREQHALATNDTCAAFPCESGNLSLNFERDCILVSAGWINTGWTMSLIKTESASVTSRWTVAHNSRKVVERRLVVRNCGEVCRVETFFCATQ